MRIGSPLQRIIWWSGWVGICGVFMTPLFRWRLRGWEKVPRNGNFFLLSNHTSAFDPVWVSWPIARRCNYMASAALFRIPVLGPIISTWGAFPKAKFVKDPEAMRTLTTLYERDEIIVMFPEGERTWDGRTRAVLPGIGRLVTRLGAKVVCGRILTGHMFQPRWAHWMRWVPIRCEHRVLDLDGSESPEEVNRLITEAITIDVDSIEAPPFSFGWRMAEGLPDYLWACPSCFELRSLEVAREDRNAVVCQACSARWTVDVACKLHGSTETTVARAHDALTRHFGERPRDALEGLCAQGEGNIAVIPRGSKAAPDVQATGTVRLTEKALTVGDWVLPLNQVQAVSVEIRNELWLYRGGTRYRLVPGTDSTLLWAHFLEKWRVVNEPTRPSVHS